MKGFTLIEVLIALLVFAMLGFTVSSRVGDIVSQTYSLERRTVAHWVGENQLNRLRLSRLNNTDVVQTGSQRERVVMGGRDWRIEVEVSETAHPSLRRVEVDVFELVNDEAIGPIDHSTAFIGQY